MAKREKIRIVYKSGFAQDIECEDFRVVGGSGPGFRYEWTDASPRPLLLGADDVAAVYHLNP